MAVNNNEWLNHKLQQAHIAAMRFGGQAWLLDARGVAYLPHRDLLIVSDLHFEKGSYLGHYGNPIPHLDTRATLARLAAIIKDYHPATVMCLGDSFHDAQGIGRMLPEDLATLTELISGVDCWQWVLGNHDPHIPEQLAGQRLHRLKLDAIGFCHEPEPDWPECEYQVIGHFHPKVHCRVGRYPVKGRCFVMGKKYFVMPAFGQYTGGLWVDDKVMQPLVPKVSRRCYVLQDERIFAV